MPYIIKRYALGLKRYKAWFLLSFLMPGLYLLSAVYAPNHHTAWQEVQLPKEVRIAMGSETTDFFTIDEMLAQQAFFFKRSFDVNRFFNLSAKNIQLLEQERYKATMASIRSDLTLSLSHDIIRITYQGKDPKLGAELVGYYARHLIQQARKGISSTALAMPPEQRPRLASGVESSAMRAIWYPNQLIPLLTLLVSSVLGVLVLIAALEWNDAALKSERQIARYVNLPVLGSLPDLNQVTQRLTHADKNKEKPS